MKQRIGYALRDSGLPLAIAGILLASFCAPQLTSPAHAEDPASSEEETADQKGDPPKDQPTDQQPTEESDSAGEETSKESTDRDKPTPSAEKLLEEAGEITDTVSRIRGLAPTGQIDKGVKTRKQLRKILVEKLAEEQSQKEMRQEAAVYRRLGLIPKALDYRDMILDVLTEQIAGFYDQKTGALNIMVGIPLDLQRPAMAHEIFHAIQDQKFDLTRMLEPFSARENGDFQLARSALIEGDATVLMIDFSLYETGTLPKKDVRSIVDIPMMANMLKKLDYKQLGALEKLNKRSGAPKGDQVNTPTELFDSALSKAPTIVRRVLIFPYLAGMRFVIALRSGRSWEEFNEIYDRPPVSTEQILHPQKYADRDEPVILDYNPAPVLDGYETIYDTVLGEFQMRLFLEHHLTEQPETDGARSVDVEAAAAGWDGDRLLAYENADGRVLTNHVSVWDTKRDAIEYYKALEEVSGRRYPEARTHTASGKHGSSVCFHVDGDESGERLYLERWGDVVVHLEGPPSTLDEEGNETDPTTYMLREQIWQTLERRPFREVYEERLAE